MFHKPSVIWQSLSQQFCLNTEHINLVSCIPLWNSWSQQQPVITKDYQSCKSDFPCHVFIPEFWALSRNILTVTSPSSFTPLDILISYPRATCLHQSLQISYLFNILYFIYTLCFWGHQVSKKFCLTEWNILHNTQTSKFDWRQETDTHALQ